MELEATQSVRQLQGLKNSELIYRLNNSQEYSSESRDLHSEFYYRFSKAFYKICLIVADNNGQGQDMAEEIFQETMVKAMSSVKNFIVDPGYSEEVVRKRILAWLGKIANHQLMNFFKKHKSTSLLDDSYDELLDIEIQEEIEQERANIPVSLERSKLIHAMSLLKEREQYIINMSAIHNCLNLDKAETETHFPEPVLNEICEQLKLKRGAVRVLKKRTIEKLLKNLNNI